MLAVEQFAEVRAAIERTGEKDRVLREAGITPRMWIQVQRHWLAALADEVSRGRADLADRYRRAYEAVAPVPSDTEAPAIEAPRSAEDSPAFVPSYMASKPAAPSFSVMSSAPLDPPSIAASAPIAASPAAPGMPAVAAPSALQGTALALDIPRGPVTPFRESAEGAPPSVAVRKEPFIPARRSGTAPGKDVLRFQTTPFSKPLVPAALARAAAIASPDPAPPSQAPAPVASVSAAPAVVAPPAPVSAAPAVAPPAEVKLPKVNQAPPSVSGTALALDIPKILAATPFEKNRPPPAPPAPPAVAPATPAAASPPSAPAHASLPSHPPSSASASAPAPSHPPVSASAPAPSTAIPELGVDQYAWLQAAIRRARGPAEIEQAFRALGMTAEMQKPLEERWRSRMTADPALQQRFLSSLQRYLQSQGK